MAKQDDYTRYTIRVPQDIYLALETAAQNAQRSVNAEIVARLHETVLSEQSVERVKKIVAAKPKDAAFHDLYEVSDVLKKLRKELDKLKIMVVGTRVNYDGTADVTLSRQAPNREALDEPFPEPTHEDVLRKMADRFGYELTPKKDNS